MQTRSPRLAATVLGGALVAALAPSAQAQGNDFAQPVQLTAGDALLGKGRLYPSPVAHDFDGDGRFDVFVGDLRGHITYALQQQNDDLIRFDSEQKLKDAEGKILDFGNW